MLKRHTATWAVALMGLLAAPVAWAEDLAVIIANEFYDNYPRIRDGRAISSLDRDFRDVGFEVVALRNMRSGISDEAATDLWNRMSDADRLVVVLSGHFVRTGEINWLLMSDANRPSGFTVGAAGFPLTVVMEIAAEKQGAAIVAVAADDSQVDLGPGTAQAQFSRSIPQGVTFIGGGQQDVANFISGEVLTPGRILADAARNAPRNLVIGGFLPSTQPFLPRSYRRNNEAADRDYWQRTRSIDTLDAYERYLDRYPNGLFADQARARVRDLRLTPEQRAQLEEDNLGLTRDQRRTIQRNLSLLGFNTAGIDGLFGRRTRLAISAWQRDIEVPRTGYLTANQITRLSNAAAARAEQLRAEAEARRIANERRDRQFWNRTGADGSEEGVREYLSRYPDGFYADEAQEILKEYERRARRAAQMEEREAWDRAVMAGTLEAYRAYLDQYPEGRFAEEARARVQSLTSPETPPDVVEAAKREEATLNLNGLTISLIEGQLQNLGLQPGTVDGRIDRDTRRALRRYQRATGLPVTGYVTREVIVRLLASTLDARPTIPD